VRFAKKADGTPGLAVQMKDQSTIVFSEASDRPHSFDNFVTVRGGSGFNLTDLDYDLELGRLTASVEQFDVSAERGLVSTKDLSFILQPGTKLSFNNLDVLQDATGEGSIESNGTLLAGVGSGSRLKPDADRLVFFFDQGSEVNIVGFKMEIRDSRATAVTAGGGSSLKIVFRDSMVGLGTAGIIAGASGRIEANFIGTWSSAAPADATITASVLDLNIAGGYLDLNADTHLLLGRGDLRSNGIRFEVSSVGYFPHGTITDLTVTLRENSTFGLPGNLQLVTDVGSSLTMPDPTIPLQIEPGKFPSGKFHVNLPFKRLTNAKTAAFAVTAGSAKFDVRSDGGGNFSGSNCSFNGSVAFSADGQRLQGRCDAYDGSFEVPHAGTPQFSAKVRFTLRPGFSKGIEIPPEKKGEFGPASLVSYPLGVVASLPDEIAPGESNLRFYGTAVTLSPIDFDTRVIMTVPSGLGEHQDDSNGSADGAHGPDWAHHLQEAAQAHLGCTRHWYLGDKAYTLTGSFRFKIEDSQVTIEPSHLRLDSPIDVRDDGCPDALVGGMLGLMAGSLIGTPHHWGSGRHHRHR
jgi:hypothetical protein